MRLAAAAALAALSCWTVAAHATSAACQERLLPSSPGAAAGKRPITARDLATLRDFGRVDQGAGREPFAVSPDGKHAVLTLRRGDPATDSYCIGVVLIPLAGSGLPRLLDVGGKILTAPSDVHGIPAIPSGLPGNGTPIWSPDGRRVAFLRRDGEFAQVWLAGLDEKQAVRLTALTTEPSGIRWTRDGTGIVITTRDALNAARLQIEHEGKTGYHYDERFWSLAEPYPHPPLPLPLNYRLLDLRSRSLADITPDRAAADSCAEVLAMNTQSMPWRVMGSRC